MSHQGIGGPGIEADIPKIPATIAEFLQKDWWGEIAHARDTNMMWNEFLETFPPQYCLRGTTHSRDPNLIVVATFQYINTRYEADLNDALVLSKAGSSSSSDNYIVGLNCPSSDLSKANATNSSITDIQPNLAAR